MTDPAHSCAPGYLLDIVIPVHNEERGLPGCIHRLHDYVGTYVPYSARITVADNASTDDTLNVAHRLADELPDVDVIHIDAKGRGAALHAAWAKSPADVVAYMDVDLSTDLSALMPLVAPVISGHSELAIGSRLTSSSRVIRSAKREFVSRSYNLLLRAALGARFSDAQCGFKAVRAEVARELLPFVGDTGWFFDTELLVIAERVGLRIHEVPVDWIEDPDSRVDIVPTAIGDLKGCWRLWWALVTRALPIRELRRRFGCARLAARAETAERSQLCGDSRSVRRFGDQLPIIACSSSTDHGGESRWSR
jgi:glycosyltransferase involved in cell wall biosynthesis